MDAYLDNDFFGTSGASDFGSALRRVRLHLWFVRKAQEHLDEQHVLTICIRFFYGKDLSSLPPLLDHATPLPGCSGVRSKKKNRSLSYPGHQFRRRVYEGLPDTATNLVTEGR